MKKWFLLFLFYSFFCRLASQSLDSMLNVYAQDLPEQKTYVHFDKGIYNAGETIWFKAYLFAGFDPATNSKNFYAELIDSDGKILQRKIEPVIESAAFGSFQIPDSIASGRLLFRAYTTWQLNFDTAFLFQKSILIITNGAHVEQKKSEASKIVSLQFFPEGGDLVNTLQSRVAFKSNDRLGAAVFVKGNIVNSKNEVVASFAAAHDGMGFFSLTPQPGETYHATWKDLSGKEQTTQLPAAKENGLVLNISSLRNKKNFTITLSDSAPAEMKKLVVVALLAQQKIYTAKIDLTQNKTVSSSIPVSNFPSGIIQFTVFSEALQPLAERIVFVNNDNYRFDVKMNTPLINTNFRSKNTVEIEVNDTLLSNMSLSVTDAALGWQSFGNNIISNMLLTGDIRGYVQNPAYYFSNNSDSVASHLDLVMMTHGWRRYRWEMLAQGKKPKLKFPADEYLTLNAKVFGVTNYSPLRNDEELLVFLKGSDSSTQFLQLPKTGADKFSTPPVLFYDTALLSYQFAKDKNADNQMSLAFSNNFYKGVKQVNFTGDAPALQTDSTILKRAKVFAENQNRLAFNRGVVLEEVIVKTKVKSRLEELDKKYASGLFAGGDATYFDFTQNQTLATTDVLSFLKGRVAGLQVTGDGANTQLQWRGSSTLLYLNEMQADVQMVSSISPSDIAYIKVLRPPFMGGFGGGAGGAVAIYTKKGSDVKSLPGMGLSKSRVTGYAFPKQFYIPDYSDLDAVAKMPPDYRTTLYWNPVIMTDATSKKVRFDFYNNDISRAFRIVLEGMNEEGKLVRIEKVVQ